ncbi:MAG: TonB-dependent receptor plug domain-containing protein [Prevotellaceae bacterium]|nr:TonB-dependent receptor plug domain-containing protein [Prevotellaceae bacterium]
MSDTKLTDSVQGRVLRMHIIETSDYKPNEVKPFIIVGSKAYDGELSSIDPQKIKSVTVIKGPKATDLYGEAAAGGAIVVELKKDGE